MNPELVPPCMLLANLPATLAKHFSVQQRKSRSTLAAVSAVIRPEAFFLSAIHYPDR